MQQDIKQSPQLITTAQPLVRYRSATPDDAEWMCWLRTENWRPYVLDADQRIQDWMEDQINLHRREDYIQAQQERIRTSFLDSNPDQLWFCVAELADRPTGYIAGKVDADGNQEIVTLHVEPGQTNHGLGTGLLNEFFDHFGHSRRTTVKVVSGTRAKGFYTKHGFQVSHIDKGQWDGVLDATIMAKEASDEV